MPAHVRLGNSINDIGYGVGIDGYFLFLTRNRTEEWL